MPRIVDIDLFKKHVRADDFADDDAYLQHLLDAAERHVLQYTHRSYDELLEMGGGDFPPPLLHAMMLIGGHWYNQRESVAGVQMHSVPDALQSLLKPYRRLA